LPDAAIGFFFLYFPLQNSENKVSFDEIRKNLSFSHQRNGFANMSFGFITRKKYPKSLINVEKFLKSMVEKRYDVVVFNSDGSIAVLIECKAPEVKLHKPHLTKLLVTI
jgi:hypothetical protein